MPLYYLRYWLEPREMMPVFESVIVWIEFAPVWAALIVEAVIARKKLASK